jgi:hypothetical protein
MVEKSAKEKSHNFPFRSRSQIELRHKEAFLYFVNDLEEFAIELKKLTPICCRIFGGFPNRPVSGTFEDYCKLWSKISHIVSNCIWSEYGLYDDYSSWSKVISEINYEYKTIHNIYDKFQSAVFNAANKSVGDNFEGERTISANSNNFPDINTSYFKFEVIKNLRNTLKEDYPFIVEIEKARTAKLEELMDFQRKFDDITTRFYLKKQWLADAVFLAIWDGTGKLKTHNFYSEDLDLKLLSEIEEELGCAPKDENEFEKMIRLRGNIPLPNPFVFDEPFSLLGDFKNYEKRAIKAFRQYLHQYFAIVKKSFKKHGHKTLRGDEYDYQQVQRLVIWNISDFECLWEVIQHIPEFYDVDVNEDTETYKCEEKLRKSFKKYEKYDLPVRPYGSELIRQKKQA